MEFFILIKFLGQLAEMRNWNINSILNKNMESYPIEKLCSFIYVGCVPLNNIYYHFVTCILLLEKW